MNDQLNLIVLKAKGDELKERFYRIFLRVTIESLHTLKLNGSYHNYYNSKKELEIDSFHFFLLVEHAKLSGIKPIPTFNEEIKLIKNTKIYYENLTVVEFTKIIFMVRNTFLQFGVYIEHEIVTIIIDFYYKKFENKFNSEIQNEYKYK